MTHIQTSPDEIVSEASSADLEQIRKWNETVTPPVEACVHHLIENQVRIQPDDEAVCSREGSLTYRELDAYAKVIASRLVSHGIKPDDLVTVCFEKSMWTVVAMLAILKAGAAFVPIPCSPVQRIKTMLSLIKSTIILTSTQQAHIFADLIEHVIVVGKDSCDKVEPAELERVGVDVQPSNLAYVMFTSGSTGTPKGAQIEHSQLCTHLKSWGDAVGFNRTSRVFQFGAHVFDVVIDEIFLPMIHGGTVCIPSDDDRLNNISGAMRDMRVTHAFFTPSLLSTLRPEDFDLATLKTLIICGESPPQDLLTLWASIPDLQVYNAYGPTECCVICCAANNTRDGPRAGNIGRAIGDTYWVVHSSDINKLVAIGDVGELLIEGPTVGRGYIGADEKSATAFVQVPSWLPHFRKGSDQRFYRTGDLVKYSKDGTIIFIGRKDNQVKIRGQRMELGEVEHHLRRVLPSRTAVIAEIISTESSEGEPMLVAFICLEGKKDVNKSESSSGRLVTDPSMKQQFNDLIANLKPQLSEILPSYMIPSAFVAVESMPHLDSSKADRVGLRKIYTNSLSPTRASQRPPLTDMEKQLQHIWAKAFRIAPSRIGLDEHFFRLGGDSVTAIRLVAIARRVGLSLTVHMLFDHPIIARLAAAVQLSVSTSQEKGMPEPYALLGEEIPSIEALRLEAATQCGISLNLIQDIYPLPRQYQTFMAAPELRAAIKFPLPVEVDLERYLECWKRLILSHDMLRTRIIKTATGMYSVVTMETPNIRTATNLESFITEEKKSSVGFGGVLSAYCLSKDPNDARKTFFVWTAHHIIHDGWALGLLNTKLRRAYANFNFAPTEELKPKQLVQYFQSLDRTAIQDYWRAHYAGVTIKPLLSPPVGRSWVADQKLPLRINLSPPSINSGSQFTIPTIASVAWALALSRHFRVADVALGSVRSGRTLPVKGVESYIGILFNIPPWCVHIEETTLAQNLLSNFQRDFWESAKYETIGYLEIMNLSPEAAAASRNNVLLNIYAKDVEAEEMERLEGSELPAPLEEPFYHMPSPLRLDCDVDMQGVSAVAHYDRSIGTEAVQKLMNAFEKAFMGLSNAREGQRICDIGSE